MAVITTIISRGTWSAIAATTKITARMSPMATASQPVMFTSAISPRPIS